MNENHVSQIFGVSIRGWISVSLTVTVCGMSFFGMGINEPLYSAFLLALGFYFGQAKQIGVPHA